MRRSRRLSVGIFLLFLCLAGAPGLLAAETPAAPAGESETNIQIMMVVGKTGGPGGDSEREFRMLTREGSASRFLMGWRTPIPTGRSGGDKGADATVMSFTYQNVGVTADLTAKLLGKSRVRVSGSVEVSAAREPQGANANLAKAPLIGTFQQNLDVVLQLGQPLRVAEGPDPEAGMVYLELRADVLN